VCIERDEETPVDDYAAESPTDRLAVSCGYFSEAPYRLRA
jgi:Mlc titration factor MtfA (ptsG expression regulator)